MENITIKSFLGIKSVAISLLEKVMIVGPNGAGKSSVQNAIRFALCNDPVRVGLKKESKMLINDGDKSATITIDGSTAHIMPSKVIYDGRPLNHLPAYLLDMHSFSAANQSGRAAIINELSSAFSADAVVQAGAAAGLNSEKLAQVLPLLSASLDTAKESADKEARTLKGEWKGVTGEVWGSDKALVWKPSVDPEAEAKLAALNSKIDENEAELLNIMVRLNEWDSYVAPLRALLIGYQQNCDHWEDLKGRLNEAEEQTKKHEQCLIENNPFEEICSSIVDVEHAINTNGEVACPCCKKSILIIETDDKKCIVDYEQAVAVVAKFRAELDGYKRLTDVEYKIRNDISQVYRTLSKQDDAKAKLDDVMKNFPADFDVDKAATRAEELKRFKSEAMVRKQQLSQANAHAANAQSVLERATATNEQINEWLAISEFFSPSGAAAKLLGQSVDKLNSLLSAYSEKSGWKQVVIAPDFSITYGGREIRLLSESEQWRADAMLTVAINNLFDSTGKTPVILDRFDVLDLEGRGQLIEWAEGTPGQWLMFGTLKTRPEIQGFQTFWIENGYITQE